MFWKINNIAELISGIAGLMTILGVSGIVSWGISRRRRSGSASKIYGIFTYSIRTSMCLGLAWATWLLFNFLHGMFQLLFEGQFHHDTFYWDPEYPVRHTLSYILWILVLVPMLLIIFACVYSWSFVPLKRLLKRFNTGVRSDSFIPEKQTKDEQHVSEPDSGQNNDG